MSADDIMKFKLELDDRPETDWTAFDARTDAENRAAAEGDPDAQPWSPGQVAAAVTLLRVIWSEPDAVRRAIAAE